MRPGGHLSFEAAQVLLGRDEVTGAGKGVLAQREAEVAWRALIVQRHARSLRECQLALERDLSGDAPEKRRLPSAVRARQRKPLPAVHAERDSSEEWVACELLAEVGRDQDRHGG